MASKMVKLSSQSSKFDWEIGTFSKLDKKGIYSDVFSVGSFKWKALIYPKGVSRVNDQLSLFLSPVDLTTSKKQKDSVKNKFSVGVLTHSCLSDLHDPGKGYLLNDTCVIRVEVTCTAKEELKDDDDDDAGNLNKLGKTVNEKQTEEDEKTSSESGELRDYPGAGQHFGEGRNNNKVGFCNENEYEDVGGFGILKAQAPLYRQIWLKYGHIASTKVIPISSYPTLVVVVNDLMNCILDMHQLRVAELSSKTIQGWEEKIKMAEKIEFNIGWLREHFESVKKRMDGMQKVKSLLLEHGQPLCAAKTKIKAIGDELKIAEMQLTAAQDCMLVNVPGLLRESGMKMYLKAIGDELKQAEVQLIAVQDYL